MQVGRQGRERERVRGRVGAGAVGWRLAVGGGWERLLLWLLGRVGAELVGLVGVGVGRGVVVGGGCGRRLGWLGCAGAAGGEGGKD